MKRMYSGMGNTVGELLPLGRVDPRRQRLVAPFRSSELQRAPECFVTSSWSGDERKRQWEEDSGAGFDGLNVKKDEAHPTVVAASCGQHREREEGRR